MIKIFNRKLILISIGLFLSIYSLSCLPGDDDSSNPTSSTDTTASTGDSTDTSTTSTVTVKELSFFEEALEGLWSRYHSYDKSTKYIKLDGDRTACDWEEASGSNYRKDKDYFTNWEITNESGNNKFIVSIKGSGLSYTFDYSNNVLYPTDFPDLKYYPSTSGKMCE